MSRCKLRRRLRPLPVWEKIDTDPTERECSVTFGTVEVREFDRMVCDNTDVANGLAIDWGYTQQQNISVDDYKNAEKRLPSGSQPNKCLRLFRKLNMSASSMQSRPSQNKLEPKIAFERLKILKAFGYSNEELHLAEKERLRKLTLEWPNDVEHIRWWPS